jgi:hypothetical protein
MNPCEACHCLKQVSRYLAQQTNPRHLQISGIESKGAFMDKRTGKKAKVKKPATPVSTVPSQTIPVLVPIKKPNSGHK